jgi:hypothetical protein
MYHLDQRDSLTQIPDTFDSKSEESVEKRGADQLALLNQSSNNRQQLIELLRQAYNRGWKPSLKHYMPATRFGRHLR